MNAAEKQQVPQRTAPVPVSRALLQRRCACGGMTGPDGVCNACRQQRTALQRQVASGARNQPGVPRSVHDVLKTPGQPLDQGTRSFMEPRFGHDFSNVRVHADDKAAASARSVNALAYTIGNHVAFGAGQYGPGTSEGRRLLAHELAHTVQQRDAHYSGEPLEVGAVGDGYEQQAEASSERALRGETASVSGHIAIARMQRSPGPPPVTAQTDFSAVAARLDAIIRNGPMPSGTRVIGAAVVDVPGYTGPKEIRALSSMATDELGQGADVEHAGTPQNRTLPATRGISGSGPRREFPFSHINDAEMKIFEHIRARLPPNAAGTIHFSTMRFRIINGQQVLEPIPACSGCTRATFDMAGNRNVQFISHAPAHPTTSLGLSSPPPGKSPAAPTTPSAMTPPAGGGAATRGAGRFVQAAHGIAASAVKILAVIVWNYLMAKVERWLESKIIQPMIEARVQALQPAIGKMFGEKLAAIPDSQLRDPKKPLFGDVTILTTIFRSGDEDQAVVDFDVAVASVAVGTEKIEAKTEQSRIWVRMGGKHVPAPKQDDLNLLPRAPRDLIRTTNSIPLSDLLSEAFEREERERRQQEIARKLEEKAKEEGGNTPPPPTPKLESLPSLQPKPISEPPSLLPGAPGPDPIQEATQVVQNLTTSAERLVGEGTALAARIGSDNAPKSEERQKFAEAERTWRLLVEHGILEYKKRSREEAVQKLGELLDRQGRRLAEIRIRLVG